MECDHTQHLYKDGNGRHELNCRCGQMFEAVLDDKCPSRKSPANFCYCQKIANGDDDVVCVNPKSSHTCDYQGVNNTLHWQSTTSTSDLLHPSGLKHRHQCTVYLHKLPITDPKYRPCPACVDTVLKPARPITKIADE